MLFLGMGAAILAVVIIQIVTVLRTNRRPRITTEELDLGSHYKGTIFKNLTKEARADLFCRL